MTKNYNKQNKVLQTNSFPSILKQFVYLEYDAANDELEELKSEIDM